MMVKIVSVIAFIALFFLKVSQVHGSEYIRYANEAKKAFITEMGKKHGWVCVGSGASMPYDVESLDAMFYVYKKVSKEEARELLVTALERFREIVHASEKLRPYLRYYPLDIDSVSVSLYFHSIDDGLNIDGGVASVCNSFGGYVSYDAAEMGNKPGLHRYYEIAKETYDEALKALHLEKGVHISLRKKAIGANYTEESRNQAKMLSKEQEPVLVQYGPGDELKILEIEYPNFCNTVEEAIRDRVTGISEKYFDEELFKTLAEKQIGQLNGEYVGYWPNGELRVKVEWKNGKPDGHMHGWYPDCTEAFKGYFKEGLKQGIQISCFPPENRWGYGNLARICNYNLEGNLNDEQVINYPDGRLKGSVYYKNGKLDRDVSLWHVGGGELNSWKYRKGKLISNKKKITNGK